ncbi:MAG: hypothetical protein MH472_08290 [Bacteroidia bacterium]|nr:hypothetical protein [Bacteroidia bacterium]
MLLLMDGTSDAERLLDCSIKIFHNQKDHFNGAFVDGISSNNLNEVFDTKEHLSSQFTRSEIIEKILHTDLNNSNEFINRFVKKCEELNLRTKVFIGPEETNEDLVKESMFNDLFLIGKDIFRKPNVSRQSFDAIESLMRNTKCPIVLLSCEQISFQNVVLIYDGSKRSFDAIKLFMYLMSESIQKNNLILNIVVTENSSNNEKGVIDYLKNYKLHFSINRVYPDNYYSELLNLLVSLNSFLLVTGVNRNDILEDLIFNKEHSFFMHGQRSIFFG